VFSLRFVWSDSGQKYGNVEHLENTFYFIWYHIQHIPYAAPIPYISNVIPVVERFNLMNNDIIVLTVSFNCGGGGVQAV
jgi:hypothetical protein